jgi:drug/metabolite transporter (DMT)-like permease
VWLSLLYLIVAGSIMGFTAYVWLLHHESPTKVGTYAYVNPIVAVTVGYFFGGESIGLRTILGTLFILISVVVITTTKAKPSVCRTKPRYSQSKTPASVWPVRFRARR